MKKLFFCLATTALMTIGCSTKANAYKVTEKKFEEEITNYGYVFNNNAKFEGSFVLSLGEEAMMSTIVMEFDSQGEHQRFRVHQETEGEGGMDSVCDLHKLESGDYNIDWYRKGYGDTNYELVTIENLPYDALKSYMNELVYFPALEYKDVEFEADNNTYHCDSYTVAIQDGGETFAAVYSNINLQFENNRVNKFEFTLAAPGGMASIQLEKTQTGGITVELPTVE